MKFLRIIIIFLLLAIPLYMLRAKNADYVTIGVGAAITALIILAGIYLRYFLPPKSE